MKPEIIEYIHEPYFSGNLIKKISFFNKTTYEAILYDCGLILNEKGKIQRFKFGSYNSEYLKECTYELYVQKRTENSFYFFILPYTFEVFTTKNSKDTIEWLDYFKKIKGSIVNDIEIGIEINSIEEFKKKINI